MYLQPEFRKSTKYGGAEGYDLKTRRYEEFINDMDCIGRYYRTTKIHDVTTHNTKQSEHPQRRIPKHVRR